MIDASVKLPRQMPGGVKTNKHPFLWLIANRLGERSKRQLALDIGVRAQTIYGWERVAEEHPRHFLLPAPRARQIAEWFGVEPKLLRPDLWG